MFLRKQKTQLEPVQNVKRKLHEPAQYIHLWAEYEGVKQHFLFTASQLKVAAARAKRNPEDLPQPRRCGLFCRLFKRCTH